MSNTISIEVERCAVIRQDRYELPCVHLVLEEQAREEGELIYVDVECKCWGYYDPGKLSGPPEDCYPPEGDFEIQEIILPRGMGDYKFELTASEQAQVEESFFNQEPDFDSPDDYDYDYDY